MKIVFFYRNAQKMSGALQQFFYLADAIAKTTTHKVYYINYYNEAMETYFQDSPIIFRDINKLDIGEFKGAFFITSLNYCFLLAEMMETLEDSKILLYDWHAYASNFLLGQLKNLATDWKSLFAFFSQKKAVAFMDSATKYRLENHTSIEFQNNIIPVAITPNNIVCKLSDTDSNRIRVGYLGRLDIDKIYSVINIADNLLKIYENKPIDFHIIGDGNKRNIIPLNRYAGKIRFIFTSYLVGDDMYQYVAENIDVLITMGMAALNGAEIGLPTLIVPISNRRFYSNEYVFLYDALNYYLGGIPKEVKSSAKNVYTLEEALEIALNNKRQCGQKCKEYMKNHHVIFDAAEKAVHYIAKSEMTMGDFLRQPIVAEQYSFFKNWQNSHNGGYTEFVKQVQAERSKKRQGRYTKLRNWIIKNIVDKPLGTVQKAWSKHLRYQKYMQAQKHYEIVLQHKREKVVNGNVLQVAFTVILDSAFPSLRIFKEMKKDARFKPVIIVVPDVQRGIDYLLEAYERTLTNLQKEFGEDVIGGYDVEADQYLELGEEYDLVFFSNPYIRMAHYFHHVAYFLNKDVLTFYVNYGFFTVKFGREIVKQDFYNYVWRVFIDSELNYKDLKKTEPIKGKNGVVSGYIQMDDLADISLPKSNRKCVLISPHHTVMGWKALDISNFLSYNKFFLKLPEKYPEIDFIFRPHPLLFSNLTSKGIWSNDEVTKYLEQIEKLPNMTYDNSGDYLKTFAKSDAIIHDCASFTAEYLFTEKPCCYMLKNEEQIKEVFLPMGELCMQHYYKAFCEEDICKFINDVVIRELDPMRTKREQFARKKLKFNFPNSAVTALNYIKDNLGM